MKTGITFKSRMDAFRAIRGAAASGNTAEKNRLIKSAHKQYPPKK